jgi:hypothetical protein
MADVKGTAPKSATPAVKKSVTTELVMGKAAASLQKAVSDAMKVAEDLSKLSGASEDLALTISNQENRIEELATIFTEKERQLQLDLDLKMRANAEDVVAKHLAAKNHRAVPNDEYARMEKDINEAETVLETTIKAEIGKAEGMAKSRFEGERRLMEAEYNAKEASNKAEIENLKKENTFLTGQVESWKRQLDEERKASIERAKAGSIGTLNVGDPSTRR